MRLIRWALAFVTAVCALGIQAAELKVLTADAFKPVLLALQPELEAGTAHKLRIHQIGEILPVLGVTQVVPLPAQIHTHTPCAAGLSVTSAQPQAAQAPVQALQAEGLRGILQRKAWESAP